VAMDLKDLEPYLDPPPHVRRAGIHSPPYRTERAPVRSTLSSPPPAETRDSPERLTLSDALRDPEISAAATTASPERYHRRSFTASDNSDDYGFTRTDPDPHCENPEFEVNILPYPHNRQRRTADPFSSNGLPAAQLHDEEPGPEEPTPQQVLDYRSQRSRVPHRTTELGTNPWGGFGTYRPTTDSADRERERQYPLGPFALHALESLMRPRDSSPPPPVPALPPSILARTDRSRTSPGDPGMGDPNVTVASFSIQRNKHAVAVKFDPSISGRYVLVKLWAAPDKGNVDVQSVIVKGYGGQRFFPAIERT